MDEQTSFVLLHVGTNNLQRSVWNIDKHSYLNLYISIADQFCAAKIIFSAILPRWESDNLFEQSVYYNRELCTLCNNLTCLFFEASDEFIRDCDLHSVDGLHLNLSGKHKLAIKNVSYINLSSSAPVSLPKCHNIPNELKILKPRQKRPNYHHGVKRTWTSFCTRKEKSMGNSTHPRAITHLRRHHHHHHPPLSSSANIRLPSPTYHTLSYHASIIHYHRQFHCQSLHLFMWQINRKGRGERPQKEEEKKGV